MSTRRSESQTLGIILAEGALRCGIQKFKGKCCQAPRRKIEGCSWRNTALVIEDFVPREDREIIGSHMVEACFSFFLFC
jgi:hypothetical protein